MFEPHLFDDACALTGIDPAGVSDFVFREGAWPGGVSARLTDGSETKILKLEDWKDEFNLLKLFYAAPRCTLCTDFSGEYADLSAGDPWLRGRDGSYLFEDGRTAVLVRTEAGDRAARRAEEDGWLEVHDLPLETWMVNFEFVGRYKRDYVPKRLLARRLFGLPTPSYGRPLGIGAPMGWVTTILRTCIAWGSRWRWFRTGGLRLAQSRPALAYLRWNRDRKARRHSTRYESRMAFVRRVITRSPDGAGVDGVASS